MKAAIVTSEFGDYAKGAKITDAEEIKRAIENHSHRVVMIEVPDEPKK